MTSKPTSRPNKVHHVSLESILPQDGIAPQPVGFPDRVRHLPPGGHFQWLWAFVFLWMLVPPRQANADFPPPNPSRLAELVHLVRQDCGSCHGMTLQGGLGPPLRPESLQQRTAGSLAAAIYYGRPGTPMPPWKPFMSESEAIWIADQLKAGTLP